MSTSNPRSLFAHYCQRLYDKGLVHATAGNVSLRVADDDFLVSPSGWCLGDIEPDHVLSVSSHPLSESYGNLKPSSEWPIHERIYAIRPEIGAVVHAHPIKATALSIAGIALDKNLLAEVILCLGPVPLIPYILPGSDALADAVAEAIKTHHALLLGNHGVITTGSDLKEAYYRMELVESLAEMVITARLLGKVNELTVEELSALYQFKHHTPLGHDVGMASR